MFDDPVAYATAVEPLLAADRVRSTVVSTMTHGAVVGPGTRRPVLVAAFDAGVPIAAAIRTTQAPVVVVTAPDRSDAAGLLAPAVLAGPSPPDLVSGPENAARAFAAGWIVEVGGGDSDVHTALLQYRLDNLIDPIGVPGGPRAVDVDDPIDVALAADWLLEFGIFTRTVPTPTGPDPEFIRARAGRGAVLVLWEVAGEPVALAGHTAVVGGMARIGPVYTPEEQRGRRYGSAVTAAAVRSAVAAGATELVLFTDLDYPTSNAVYRRLGFVEVGRFAELTLPAPRSSR